MEFDEHHKIKIKIPKGFGWILGAIFGIVIWIISFFILTESGTVMGVILGFGGGTSLAISIESQHLELLNTKQQKRLEALFVCGIVILIIWVLILTFNLLSKL